MLLPTTLRVRDLLHGYVYLTDIEKRVVNHKLFQRLRHIRQNDVAFLVYPSMNTARFEHSIGCAHVAGRMAESMIQASPAWEEYRSELGLSDKEFVQACRLYALLHDVGHFPLSHLFESAVDGKNWFPDSKFSKIHEAAGELISKMILAEVDVPKAVREVVEAVLSEKKMALDSCLRPIKQLVDFEVDADRTDSIARDGRLAGGEWGTYDIERICTAVRLQHHESGWRLAYFYKAMSSLQSLLLDRCRVHAWVHYHHRVVALKTATIACIRWLVQSEVIGRDDFDFNDPDKLMHRDDVWLWGLLRDEYVPAMVESGSESYPVPAFVSTARKAMLWRDKDSLSLMWKRGPQYQEWMGSLATYVGKEDLSGQKLLSASDYEDVLTKELGVPANCYEVKFAPLSSDSIPLVDENGEEAGILSKKSEFIASLRTFWRDVPEFFIVLYGSPPMSASEAKEAWIHASSSFVV